MGLREEMEVEIRFPYHISGPSGGWRSAWRRVAMLRAITDLHAGVLSLRVWKANYIDHWLNIADARRSEARAATPRAPVSLRIWVQEQIATPQ